MIENYFVCIGAQKAGTTWLMRVLESHPEIFVTPVKEINYFNHRQGNTHHLDYRRRRARKRKYYQRMASQWSNFSRFRAQRGWYRDYMREMTGDDWYGALFSHRGGARMAGEGTPEYALTGVAGFRHMARLAPDARLIYILRNPVERSWSQLKHYARRNRLEVASLSAPRLIEIQDSAHFEAHGDYLTVLDNLAKVFAPEQLHIGFYETIHAGRLVALEQICAFLGVGFQERYFGNRTTRFNASQSGDIPVPVRDHLRRKYTALAGELERRLGPLPQSWSEDFDISQ